MMKVVPSMISLRHHYAIALQGNLNKMTRMVGAIKAAWARRGKDFLLSSNGELHRCRGKLPSDRSR